MRWSLFRSQRHKSRSKGDKQARAPQFECLEDRTLPAANVISGQVYHDVNGNGTFDAGDTAIANSTIQLQTAAGAVVATTTTDANGAYKFDHDPRVNTAPKTLEQTITIPSTLAGFTLTKAVNQFDPSLGELLSVEIVHEGSMTSEIRVENSSTHVGADIKGVVSGVLKLTGPGVNIASSVSENAGTFTATPFDNVIDFGGTSGKTFAPKTVNATPKTITLTGADMTAYIGTGQVQFTEDVEVTSTASGGGNVMIGIKSEATATITVRYRYRPKNDLPPGDYVVVQTEQPFIPGTGNRYFDGKEYKSGVEVPNSIGQDRIAVTLTGGNSANNDFTELPPASLGGFVYLDQDNDGIKENDLASNGQPREPGIAGVTISLTGTDDTGAAVNKQVQTASDGSYLFTNLRPGTYAIRETQPAAFADGKDTIGTPGGTTGNDEFTNIVLKAGIDGRDNNFGELPKPKASISGYVYEDTDNDGVRDPGEPGISGAKVTLIRRQGDSLLILGTATTNADGFYQFGNLEAGTYNVTEAQQPAGYADGKDTAGTEGGTVNNDSITNIVLGDGVTATDYNFGERRLADVGVLKSANPGTVLAGGTVNYTLTVSNFGPSTADNVQVIDSIPAGMTVQSVNAPGWQVVNDNGMLIFKRDSMVSGAVFTIDIVAQAPINPGIYPNTVTVQTTTTDTNPGNNQATASVTVPQPEIKVSVPPTTGGNEVLTKALLLASGDFWLRLLS